MATTLENPVGDPPLFPPPHCYATRYCDTRIHQRFRYLSPVRSLRGNSIGETCIEDNSTSPPPHLNSLPLKSVRDSNKNVRYECGLPPILHPQICILPSDHCRRAIRSVGCRPERRSVMDTMTYAPVAVLPWSIAEERTHFVRQDVELLPLHLSMIKR